MTFARRLTVLSALYLAQGLPYGFQSFALPIFLRRSGASLTAIGLLSALSLPWLFKPLWAPLVDRYGLTRRTWIVPLTALFAATCFAAACIDPTTSTGMTILIVLIFTMNLLAATQDIAVDGLAVDLLERKELGPGNVAQVVGYKCGMVIGGQLFVFASVYLRWHVLFVGMGGLVLIALASTLLVEERPRIGVWAVTSFRDLLATLWTALALPGCRALILFIVTYKLGENIADTIWKPWLVDTGYGDAFIGGAFGLTGAILSTAGSFVGGFLSAHETPERALWLAAGGRVLPLLGQAIITVWGGSPGWILLNVGVEHFCGGALTTVVFALMMMRVDKRIGATHYTILAAIEVLGKLPAGPLAGIFGEHFGYTMTFVIATALTAVQLVTIPALRRSRT